METVRIYKIQCTKSPVASMEIGTFFSLDPWGENTMHYEGLDLECSYYVLPKGFEVAEFQNNPGRGIFDDKGCHCTLTEGSSGRPCLVSSNGFYYLEKLERGEGSDD